MRCWLLLCVLAIGCSQAQEPAQEAATEAPAVSQVEAVAVEPAPAPDPEPAEPTFEEKVRAEVARLEASDAQQEVRDEAKRRKLLEEWPAVRDRYIAADEAYDPDDVLSQEEYNQAFAKAAILYSELGKLDATPKDAPADFIEKQRKAYAKILGTD